VPTATDDWERDGRVVLPDEYAEWSQQQGGSSMHVATFASSASAAHTRSDSVRVPRFRILSPQDGDKYAVPTGVESRYATISLRAVGPGAADVRWLVDGAPYEGERWPLAAGTHVFKAVTARGDSAEARIAVER
jgi:membrane carboxypeptidase/penicillin-binding protein PbpC